MIQWIIHMNESVLIPSKADKTPIGSRTWTLWLVISFRNKFCVDEIIENLGLN